MLSKFSSFSALSNNNVSSGSYRFGQNSTELKYVTIPASNDWAFGTDDFTVEWFQYQTQASPPDNSRLFEIGEWSNSSFSVSIEDGGFLLWLNQGNTYYVNIALQNYLNQWVHFAIARQSGIVSMWQAGNRIFNLEINNSITNNTSDFWIGSGSDQVWNGYLNNFRLVTGVSAYDVSQNTIPVPSSNLTNVEGTKLLLFQNNNLIDHSSYNREVTNYGAIWSNLAPF